MRLSSFISSLLLSALLLVSPAYASIISSIPYNLTNGSVADATQVMGNFNTIVTDVNANGAKNGANSDITSLTGLTTPLSNTYGGTIIYTGGTTAGAANVQTLASTVPSDFALTAGNIVTAIAGFTNTSTATLNVNSAGAKAVDIEDSTGLHALSGGEIFAGNSYAFYYDGTEFILLNPSLITGNAIASSVALAGSPTTTTQSASDSSTKIATTAFVHTAVNGSALGQAQLQYVSTTGIKLAPYRGNTVSFPDGTSYTVPSSGLASGSISGGVYVDKTASSTLSASTLYYVYLWENSGTPKLDFSTTGHSADSTTGIEIETGDSTQVLVGMVYPQTGPVFADSAAARLVASWFNRQPKYLSNSFTTDRTITQTALTEVNSEIRCAFLTWGDAFTANYSGGYSQSGNANPQVFAIGLDGVSTIVADNKTGATTFSGDGWMNGFGGSYATTAGYHYITLGASSSTGTITFYRTGNSGLSGTIIM